MSIDHSSLQDEHETKENESSRPKKIITVFVRFKGKVDTSLSSTCFDGVPMVARNPLKYWEAVSDALKKRCETNTLGGHGETIISSKDVRFDFVLFDDPSLSFEERRKEGNRDATERIVLKRDHLCVQQCHRDGSSGRHFVTQTYGRTTNDRRLSCDSDWELWLPSNSYVFPFVFANTVFDLCFCDEASSLTIGSGLVVDKLGRHMPMYRIETTRSTSCTLHPETMPWYPSLSQHIVVKKSLKFVLGSLEFVLFLWSLCMFLFRRMMDIVANDSWWRKSRRIGKNVYYDKDTGRLFDETSLREITDHKEDVVYFFRTVKLQSSKNMSFESSSSSSSWKIPSSFVCYSTVLWDPCLFGRRGDSFRIGRKSIAKGPITSLNNVDKKKDYTRRKYDEKYARWFSVRRYDVRKSFRVALSLNVQRIWTDTPYRSGRRGICNAIADMGLVMAMIVWSFAVLIVAWRTYFDLKNCFYDIGKCYEESSTVNGKESITFIVSFLFRLYLFYTAKRAIFKYEATKTTSPLRGMVNDGFWSTKKIAFDRFVFLQYLKHAIKRIIYVTFIDDLVISSAFVMFAPLWYIIYVVITINVEIIRGISQTLRSIGTLFCPQEE